MEEAMMEMDALGISSAILTMLGMIGIVLLVAVIIQIVSHWFIFQKAGEAGWKSLIPIYNNYIVTKIAWKPIYFWITLCLSFISSLLASSDSNIVAVMAGLISIALVILSVMQNINLARKFGQDDAFAIGLIFLPIIFLPILAFGNAQYHPEEKTMDIGFIEELTGRQQL